MNKKKLKIWFSIGAVLLIGVVLTLIGISISNPTWYKYLLTPTAYLMYALVFIFILVTGFMLFKNKE